MRTANEWYRKINSYSNPDSMNDVERACVEIMIKAIQKEAIEECAKYASVMYVTSKVNGRDYPQVNVQSILSLINELK